MQTIKIIKGIYSNPGEVFEEKIMEASLPEATIGILVLGMLTFLFMPSMHIRDLPFQQAFQKYPLLGQHPRVIVAFSLSAAYAEMCAQMGLVRALIHSYKRDVSWKALIAMAFWISIAFAPLGWLLSLIPFRRIGWLQSVLNAFLLSYGISRLSKFGLGKSLWIYILSFVILIVLATPVLMIVASSLGAILMKAH